MTIKELRNYRAICSQIDHIDRKIKGSRIHVKDSVQSASKHPYSVHNVTVEGDIYDHSSPVLLAKKHRLEVQKQNIESFIENIPDSKIKEAIEIYCTEPIGEDGNAPEWNDVADRLADGSTKDSVRMLVTRFLEKNS